MSSDPSAESTTAPRPSGPRLTDYRPVSAISVNGPAALLFGLPFLASGLYIILIALGSVDVPPGDIHAPLWVIGLAGGVFAAPGLALIVHGLGGMLRRSRLEAGRRANPYEPWLADHAWDDGVVASRERTSLVWQVAGAAIWIGILGALNWWAFGPEGSLVIQLFAGFFDALGLLVLAGIVRGIGARWKYGTPWLELETLPIRPGQDFNARLCCARDLSVFDELQLSLRFVEERYEIQGSGKNRSQVVACYEQRLFQQRLSGLDARAGSLPFHFEVPADAPTTDLRSRPASFWDLEVHAATEGIDFHHRFLVPIYAAAEESAAARAA